MNSTSYTNFRDINCFRSSSYDPYHTIAAPESATKRPSIVLGPVNAERSDNKTDNDGQQAIRPRSSSYGGGRKYARHKGVHADRQPFSDYTMFSNKDPKVDTEAVNSKTTEVEIRNRMLNNIISKYYVLVQSS